MERNQTERLSHGDVVVDAHPTTRIGSVMGAPRLEPTVYIEDNAESQLAQCEGGEAGLAAVATEQNHHPVSCLGQPPTRRGCQPPLEHVSIDHPGPRNVAVALPLLDWSNVYDQRALAPCPESIDGRQAVDTAPGLFERFVEGAKAPIRPL